MADSYLFATVCTWEGRAFSRITVWCGILLSLTLFAVASCPLVYGVIKGEETFLSIGGSLLALCGLYLIGFPLTMWVLRKADSGQDKGSSHPPHVQQNAVGMLQQDGECCSGNNNNEDSCEDTESDTDSDSDASHSIHFISDHKTYHELSPLVPAYPSELTATHVTLQGKNSPDPRYENVTVAESRTLDSRYQRSQSGTLDSRYQRSECGTLDSRYHNKGSESGTLDSRYQNNVSAESGTLDARYQNTKGSKSGTSNVLDSKHLNQQGLESGSSNVDSKVATMPVYNSGVGGGKGGSKGGGGSGSVPPPPPCYEDAVEKEFLYVPPENEPLNPRTLPQPGTIVRSNESVVEFTV